VAIFVTKTRFLPSGFLRLQVSGNICHKNPFLPLFGMGDLLDGAGGSDTASYLDVTKVIADRDRQ
jgi:hypothetical protein